jgi:hypothetical protein
MPPIKLPFFFLLSFLQTFHLLQRFPGLPSWSHFSIKEDSKENKFKFSKSSTKSNCPYFHVYIEYFPAKITAATQQQTDDCQIAPPL